MEQALTFLKLAEIVLEQTKIPLTDKEIWDKAVESQLSKRISSTGKTPWKTISAQIYVDMRSNPDDTIFVKYKRPTKFGLNRLSYPKSELDADIEPEQNENASFRERDLHPFVTYYINSSQDFKAHTKTIYHEKSAKDTKGKYEWLYPDIVGVYFPFADYEKETVDLQKSLALSAVKLFSFELKKELKLSNLRKYYFQAVSNSSWAHEGYLVVSEMEESDDFNDELRRLNNAFGIGVIKISIYSPNESEIKFQSVVKSELDWSTINRIVAKNPDFKHFIEDVKDNIDIKKAKGAYDEICSLEKLEKLANNIIEDSD